MAGSESLSYCLPNGTRRHSATNEHQNNMLFLTVYLLALPLWSEVEAGQLSFTGNHWHDASEGKEIVKYKTNSQTRYEFGLPGKAVRGSYSFVGNDGRTYSVNYIADDKGFRAYGAHLPWSNLLAETANILQAEPFISENDISTGETTEGNEATQIFSVSNQNDADEKLPERDASLPTKQSELSDGIAMTPTKIVEGNGITSETPVPGDIIFTPDSTLKERDESTPETTTTQSEITTTIPPIKHFFVADVPAVTKVTILSKLVKGSKKMKKSFLKVPSKIIRFRLTYNPTYQSHTLTRILDNTV